MPDLKDLHSALERRAVAMDFDRKYARTQAYAKRRVAEIERKGVKMRTQGEGGEAAAAATSITGGKVQKDSLYRDVSNDAKDVAQRRHYWAEMVKVVDASDIILEVLDARDPEGCRCREVERMIISKMDRSGAKPKRIILVMNKIDLVSHENLMGWMKHLKREYQTVAFKANTQQQARNLKQNTFVSKGTDCDEKTLGRSGTVGSQQLIQELKKYSLSLGIKTSVTVGIIGYPNVSRTQCATPRAR